MCSSDLSLEPQFAAATATAWTSARREPLKVGRRVPLEGCETGARTSVREGFFCRPPPPAREPERPPNKGAGEAGVAVGIAAPESP